MKDKSNKKELFRRFLNDEYSEEDLDRLIAYLRESTDREEYLDVAEEVWRKLETIRLLDGVKSQKILDNILGSAGYHEEIVKEHRYWIFSQHGLRIAAAILMLMLLTGLLFFVTGYSKRAIYATKFGEVKTIELPDGSAVTLNGNSTISYAKSWNTNTSREVWVEGEAFFSVVHKANHQKFIVNTAKNFKVEVLGTKFSVYKRKHGTRVVLNSGKIKLHIGKELENNSQVKNVILEPGELVEFKTSPEKYIKRDVNPEQYSSWKEDKIVLENSNLSEIIAMMDDTYGVKIHIMDSSLLEKTVSGSMPKGNSEDLLHQIEELFSVKIYKENNLLKMERK